MVFHICDIKHLVKDNSMKAYELALRCLFDVQMLIAKLRATAFFYVRTRKALSTIA